jgi:hypothetical protein
MVRLTRAQLSWWYLAAVALLRLLNEETPALGETAQRRIKG